MRIDQIGNGGLELFQNYSYSASPTETVANHLRVNNQKIESSDTSTFRLDLVDISVSAYSQNTEFGNSVKVKNHEIGIFDTAIKYLRQQQSLLEEMQKIALKMEKTDNREVLDAYQSRLLEYREKLDGISEKAEYNGYRLNRDINHSYFNASGALSGYQNGLVLDSQNLGLKKVDHIYAPYLYDSDKAYGNMLLRFEGLPVQYVPLSNQEGEGLGLMAQTINQMGGEEGIRASANVVYDPFENQKQSIQKGLTPQDFAINGVQIGYINIEENDSDNVLRNAINSISDQTGVEAYLNEKGNIEYRSDGRAIQFDGDFYKLARLNIIDLQDLPKDEKINAGATFNKGETLSEYVYELDYPTLVESISVTEFDADGGDYNVYVRLGEDEPVFVAGPVFGSGNNLENTAFMQIAPTMADQIIIRPLDENRNEFVSAGLGGFWDIRDVTVQGQKKIPLIIIGELEITRNQTPFWDSNALTYFNHDVTEKSLRQVAPEEMADYIHASINEIKEQITHLQTQKSVNSSVNIATGTVYENVDVIRDTLGQAGDSFKLAHQNVDAQRVLDLLK